MPPRSATVNDSPVPTMPKGQKARSSSNSRSAANYAASLQASQPKNPQIPTPLDSPSNSSPSHDSYALPEVPKSNDAQNARVKSYSSTWPLTDGPPVVVKGADYQSQGDRTPQAFDSRSIKPEANEVATGTSLRASSSAFVPRNLQTPASEEVEGPQSAIVHPAPAVIPPSRMPEQFEERRIDPSTIFSGIPIMNSFPIYEESLHTSVERYHVAWDQWTDEDPLTAYGVLKGVLPGRPPEEALVIRDIIIR